MVAASESCCTACAIQVGNGPSWRYGGLFRDPPEPASVLHCLCRGNACGQGQLSLLLPALALRLPRGALIPHLLHTHAPRHIFAPDPVAAGPLCMGKSSPAAGLVAPARVTPGAPADTRGAVAGAIDLAAVATTTTDQRLSVAFRIHEQPGRCRGAVTGSADIPWTSATIAGILTPHACPALCGTRRRT